MLHEKKPLAVRYCCLSLRNMNHRCDDLMSAYYTVLPE